MLGNPISQSLSRNQAQVLAQSYLDQARQQKTAEHAEVALILYDQAKVSFIHIANGRQLMPSLSEVKDVLIEALTPKTQEEVSLRRRIAEVYFERAQLLEKLGKKEKAQASFRKAQAWGYEGIQPARPITSAAAAGYLIYPSKKRAGRLSF